MGEGFGWRTSVKVPKEKLLWCGRRRYTTHLNSSFKGTFRTFVLSILGTMQGATKNSGLIILSWDNSNSRAGTNSEVILGLKCLIYLVASNTRTQSQIGRMAELLKLLKWICVASLKAHNSSLRPGCSLILMFSSLHVGCYRFDCPWLHWYREWAEHKGRRTPLNWIPANSSSCAVQLHCSVRANDSQLKRHCRFVLCLCAHWSQPSSG